MPLPREFDLIARHFRPLAGPGALDLQDDAAVFAPPAGREMVVAADAMIEGVHFLPDQPADLLARKLLRVNLSDLAAMGATPFGYLLTLAVPRDTPEAWFAAFATGLATDQAIFGVQLLGGDTCGSPAGKSLSLTVLGHVAPGMAVRRSGARAGDEIWVTGTIGDGVLGLDAARGVIADPDLYLLGRYRLPTPRLLPIAGLANAAMDVSDGLLQELGHMTRASGVAAEIDAARVPRSFQACAAAPGGLARCLAGGDDYELVLAIPPESAAALQQAAHAQQIMVTKIGHFVTGSPGVRVSDADGRPMLLEAAGWSHF